MSDYGAHPTQYGNLSDGNLYAMYRESVYRSLSESQKLDLLQETVNRDAAARGEAGSPRIQFENMPSRTDGYAEKGVISVNRDLAVNGTRTATYQGKTLQHTINDYNIQSLVTVLHENVHCYQDQIIDGTIRNADPQLAAEYHANDFTISMRPAGKQPGLWKPVPYRRNIQRLLHLLLSGHRTGCFPVVRRGSKPHRAGTHSKVRHGTIV